MTIEVISYAPMSGRGGLTYLLQGQGDAVREVEAGEDAPVVEEGKLEVPCSTWLKEIKKCLIAKIESVVENATGPYQGVGSEAENSWSDAAIPISEEDFGPSRTPYQTSDCIGWAVSDGESEVLIGQSEAPGQCEVGRFTGRVDGGKTEGLADLDIVGVDGLVNAASTVRIAGCHGMPIDGEGIAYALLRRARGNHATLLDPLPAGGLLEQVDRASELPDGIAVLGPNGDATTINSNFSPKLVGIVEATETIAGSQLLREGPVGG